METRPEVLSEKESVERTETSFIGGKKICTPTLLSLDGKYEGE